MVAAGGMIHVVVSNRTEELLAALVESLRRERAARGPFEPARLVVPNRNVETFVKLGLAQADGIAANLDVTFLRRLLARVVERALPGCRIVDAAQTEGYLLTLFHDDAFLEAAALAPVRAYLLAAGTDRDAVDVRRCQLAAEIGHLFDEYATSRPDMLAAWRLGTTLDGTGHAGIEAWQRALWLGIFGEGGLAARRSRREETTWLTLGDALEDADARGRIDAGALGPSLHVFGVSYMAPGYHRMLQTVGRATDVHLYTLNACREMTGQLGLPLGGDPLGLDATDLHPALRLWARPGRESFHLLAGIAADVSNRFVAHGTGARTLLARLQDDLLARGAGPAKPDAAGRADGSIEVIPCPGLRREIEVVAAEIWRLVHAEPTLKFNDIAVIVPPARKDAYLGPIGAVFHECHDLPHSVVDLPVGGAHRIAQAMDLLLALPFSRFRRSDLLPLLTHPSVMARFPDADADAASWRALPDALGIVHGADRSDHAGSYLERDLLTWDQGLRRLALGALMTGERSGDDRTVAFGPPGDRQDYLPFEPAPADKPGALAFLLLARSLIADGRVARTGTTIVERPLTAWLDFVRALLSTYLAPADDDEEAFLARCLAEIADLADLPLGDRPVSFRVAAELARGVLASQAGARGQHLARGVAVASFVPMRALPFRAIFLLGLGEGAFPSSAGRGRLDLRSADRRPGDVEPGEQDRYLFLETLLCARDRLILTHVARDELGGDPLPASSVVVELLDLLRAYLGPAELGRLRHADDSPPLRRWRDEARIEAVPPAAHERAAVRLGESLRRALPDGCAPPDLRILRRDMDAATFGALAARLGVREPPEAPVLTRSGIAGRSVAEPIIVSLHDIRRFLECPLQGSARFRLRMREVEDVDDAAERDEEALGTDSLTLSTLLRQSFGRALAAGSLDAAALGRAYQHVALRGELGGRLPSGIFARGERDAHQRILLGWSAELGAAAGATPAVRAVRFGPATTFADAADVRDAIRIDAGGTPVEIRGTTELLVDEGDGSGTESASLVLLGPRRTRFEGEARQKEGLRAFVDHVALAAAGAPARRHAALLCWADASSHASGRSGLGVLDRDRARTWLESVVADMLAGVPDAAGRPTGLHPYLLPCEAVFEARKLGSRTQTTISDAVEKIRDNYFEKPFLKFSSLYGPVPQAVERHDPPAAREAEAMAHARFDLFFALAAEGAAS